MHLFIDTDIFIRDLRYPQDPFYKENLFILDLVRKKPYKAFTSIFNLLEVCGILSFNLSYNSLIQLYAGFSNRYQTEILFGENRDDTLCLELSKLMILIGKKMSLGDALIASVVEHYKNRLDFFVSWNAVHFKNKICIEAFTPIEFKEHRHL